MKIRKIKIKFLSVLLAVALIITAIPGCSVSTDESSIAVESSEVSKIEYTDSRTVLIYMCGSNLETTFGAATKNIAEMLSVNLPKGVNVIIETGGAKKWRDYDIANDKISRYTIKNGKLVLLQALERSNMSYIKTFSDFLDYGFKNFPAKKTAVILWDHGSGCINGMISDENYSGSLSVDDIKTALTDAENKYNNIDVDLLGMDACLMANFETAYILRDCADYMLASEEIEPTGGWDYKALFGAIAKNKNVSAVNIGKAVCDGFCKKYSDSYNNDATLSIIDLSKIDGLKTIFNDAMGTLANKKIDVKDIRKVADSAYHSCRCGANSDYSGYSNLIDMSDFAYYYCGLVGNNDFADVVSSCIVYNATSENDSGHDGLSFYYPLSYNDESFKKYYDNICPVPSYKSYLKNVYQNMPEDAIKIKDTSVTKDGALRVDVEEESLPYILGKQFTLYEILEYEDDGNGFTEENITLLRMLGLDNDIIEENGGKTYKSNFRGITLTLNGVEIFYDFVGKNNNSYIFETLVGVNGKPCYLRFAFVIDETKFNNGDYEIIGIWDGIDPLTGMLDKGFKQLKPDDDVEVYIYKCGSAVVVDDDSSDDVQKVPKMDGGYKITEEPLKGKYYLYKFDLMDIYGRIYGEQVNAVFRMNKSYDELKKNPLPDGEYAGEVVDMWISSYEQ